MMRRLFYCFVLLVCIVPDTGFAQSDVLTISPQITRVNLTQYLSVYKDDSHTIGIFDMALLERDKLFSPISDHSSSGYSKSSFWFKFTVKNSTPDSIDWFLEYPYAVVDHFEFFHPMPSGFKRFLGGDRYPFNQWAMSFRTQVVPITLAPGEHTFYFRIQSSGAIVASLTGWGNASFERYKNMDSAINWLYYGVMLSTFIYCIFIFISMAELSFLFLAVFVLGSTLFTLAHTGMGFQFFWPNSPTWANLCHPLGGFLGIIGGLLFTRFFLHTAYHSPRLDRVFITITGIGLILGLFSPFLPYTVLTQGSVVLIGVGVLTMVVSGFVVLSKGLRQAWFYLIAWTPLAVISVLMCLKSYGFIENNLLTGYMFQLTTVFVTLIFSFGLMDKVNGFRLDRELVLNRLHESENQYRILAENVKDVIWILDLKRMKLTYATESIQDLMGYSPKEAESFGFREMLTAESAQKAMAALKTGLKNVDSRSSGGRQAFTIELECYNKAGEIFWIETSTSFVKDKSGQAIEMIGVTRDITARKNSEKKRKALEVQLHRSGKLEAMGTLAGGIAHDMNNIMSAILGYTELCFYASEEGSKLHHRLGRVIKASHRARELVRQILAFSRQDLPETRALKISLIVKEVLVLIRASLSPTIEITQKIQDREVKINADPSQVHQIIMNLCSNAGHAMMEKGGILGVSIENMVLDMETSQKYLDLEPGEYVRLIVSDTGKGMKKEILDRVFDPFFTTKPVGEGTGMGLSMVHGIVKSLGGDIFAYSEPGQGTAFHVFLPRAMDQETESEKDGEQENRFPRGKEHILYVDDEIDIVDMLSSLGYSVTGMTESPEALACFNKDPGRFDLLITDQVMPGISGMGLAGKIFEARPDLPAILCTGFNDRMPDKKSDQMVQITGIRQMILKPYSKNELAHLVRRVLDE